MTNDEKNKLLEVIKLLEIDDKYKFGIQHSTWNKVFYCHYCGFFDNGVHEPDCAREKARAILKDLNLL